MTVQTRPVKKDRSTQILLFIAAIVAIGGIAFAVGRLTASTAAAATGNGNGGLAGENGGFGRFPRGSFEPGQFGNGGARLGGLGGGVEGTVQSINGSTMTIQLANGSTATVDLSGTTTYHSETAATASDVKAGSKILVTIDTAAAASGSQQPIGSPAPGASGAPGLFGNRTITAKDVILVTP